VRARRLGRIAGLALIAAMGAAALALVWLHRRALPVTSGRLKVAGLDGPVEIVRDRLGVPHVFAASDGDAYFGLGFAIAQDRLFQLDLLRHLGQGRLAEMFGPELVKVDRLFRTMDLQAIGARRLERARPEVRAAFTAYARGINAAVAARPGRLPVEFALTGQDFAPVQRDDFVGVLGYMVWSLQLSWEFDPLYEDLVARVGPERAATLFPLPPLLTPRSSRAWAAQRRVPRSSISARASGLSSIGSRAWPRATPGLSPPPGARPATPCSRTIPISTSACPPPGTWRTSRRRASTWPAPRSPACRSSSSAGTATSRGA
jgi:acyl-homoserine lactone acylase PvdQ